MMKGKKHPLCNIDVFTAESNIYVDVDDIDLISILKYWT